MSWLYSRALVEEYSEESYLDGAQFALWNGTNTRPQSSPKDKTTGIWKHSRSGMTFKLLTDDHGEAVLTSYLAGFPAKTLASQEKAQGSTAIDRACGGTWHESSMKYDRDSHSWKTHRHLFDEVLPESSVILPKSGMIADGVLWELTTSEHRTVERESGYWLTPTAMQTDETPESFKARMKKYRTGTKVANLTMQVKNQKFWPTPCLPGNGGSHGKSKLKMMLWPTPTAHNSNEMDSPAEKTRHTPSLTHQARGGDATLPTRLNPDWVEWLMGWPIGWTDLKPLGTARYRAWRHSHSVF